MEGSRLRGSKSRQVFFPSPGRRDQLLGVKDKMMLMKANNRVELLAGTNYTLYICSLTGCSKFLLWRGGRK